MSTVFSDPARTRRLSITTLGLSGSPSHSGQGMQTSPFSSLRGRGKSMSTGSAGDGSTAENSQESAIDESDEVPPLKGSPPQGRRVSFGARAYGSASQRSGSIAGLTGVQQGMSGSGPTGTNGAPTAAGAEKDASPTSAKSGSPPGLRKSGMSRSCHFRPSTLTLQYHQESPLSNVDKGPTGEGYNWAENFRNRAERASISAASGMGIGGMTGIPGASHARTKSQAQSEPAATAPKPPPQKPPPPKGPDQFQERILKGDFYMD